MTYAFVFTNYNNSHYTVTAVDSIEQCVWNYQPDIVIVDNDSADSEKLILRELSEKYINVTVIYNTANVGYFRGLNDGLRFLESKVKSYASIIIGNNDLIFNDNFPNQLEVISDSLGKFPVVAPDIITVAGDHQNPHVLSDPSKLRELIWDIYYSSFGIARIMGWVSSVSRKYSERSDYKSWKNSGEILQGYGACYILSPIFLDRFKTLYSPTFLMGEEYFLQFQLAKKGYKTYYDPRIQVTHVDHASTGLVSSKLLWGYGKKAHKIYRQLSNAAD
ncbi:glycosyltransferase [Luminiphilus sp.]|nr:glycosyltransferase [Luminiphilus sp.]